MPNIKFETEEAQALLQIVENVSVKGSDARLITKLLDKLEDAMKDSDD